MCVKDNLQKQQELINNIRELSSQYKEVVGSLKEDVREINSSICDSYHYMEQTDLDVVRGYKAYKELQGKLRTRRELKNNIKYINSIAGEMGMIKAAYTEIDKQLADAEYLPRIHDELFEAESPNSIVSHESHRFCSLDTLARYLRSFGMKDGTKPRNRLQDAIESGTPYCGHILCYEGGLYLAKKLSKNVSK